MESGEVLITWILWKASVVLQSSFTQWLHASLCLGQPYTELNSENCVELKGL